MHYLKRMSAPREADYFFLSTDEIAASIPSYRSRVFRVRDQQPLVGESVGVAQRTEVWRGGVP
jgi:hypothetical protein